MDYVQLPIEKLKSVLGGSTARSIVMVNLLRFNGDEGRASYMTYLSCVEILMNRRGCRFIYWGSAAATLIGPETWDMVVLGEYPDRAVLLEMLESQEYAEIAHFRQNALADSRLILTEALRR